MNKNERKSASEIQTISQRQETKEFWAAFGVTPAIDYTGPKVSMTMKVI